MKELKEAVIFGIALGEGFAKSYDDKKLDYSDLLNLWEPLSLAPDAVEGSFKIKSEISNMTSEDGKQLIEWAKTEFDIPQDKIEAKVEAALDLVLGIMKFVNVVKS